MKNTHSDIRQKQLQQLIITCDIFNNKTDKNKKGHSSKKIVFNLLVSKVEINLCLNKYISCMNFERGEASNKGNLSPTSPL